MFATVVIRYNSTFLKVSGTIIGANTPLKYVTGLIS